MFLRRKLTILPIVFLVTVAFQTRVAFAERAVEIKPTPPGHSKRAAAPTAKKPPKVAVSSRPKSPITISLKSRMREGSLVVMLDNVPVLNEKFNKPFFALSQTTTWDPLQVPVGKHELTAKIVGANGKIVSSGTYNLELSRKEGIELVLRTKSGKLMVERAQDRAERSDMSGGSDRDSDRS